MCHQPAPEHGALLVSSWVCLQVVFFGQHKMKESVGWMAAFWGSIAASIAAFSQVE